MSNTKTYAMAMRQISKLFQTTLSNQMRQSSYASTVRRAIFNIDTAEDFETKVVNSDKPVVVDFFASWCSPCKALAPRLENIISEKAGEIKLAKVDIDENSDLALDYDVGSVPSMLVMRNGKVVNRLVGLQETETLRKWINDSVKKPTKKRARVEDDD